MGGYLMKIPFLVTLEQRQRAYTDDIRHLQRFLILTSAGEDD